MSCLYRIGVVWQGGSIQKPSMVDLGGFLNLEGLMSPRDRGGILEESNRRGGRQINIMAEQRSKPSAPSAGTKHSMIMEQGGMHSESSPSDEGQDDGVVGVHRKSIHALHQKRQGGSTPSPQHGLQEANTSGIFQAVPGSRPRGAGRRGRGHVATRPGNDMKKGSVANIGQNSHMRRGGGPARHPLQLHRLNVQGGRLG